MDFSEIVQAALPLRLFTPMVLKLQHPGVIKYEDKQSVLRKWMQSK